MQSWLKFLIVSLAALSLLSCGGKKARSYAAGEFEILPKEPIVILGKTKDSKGQDVEGPWFQFRVKLSNNDSEEAITLVAISLEIYVAGKTTPKVVTFSASDFDQSVKIGDTTFECKFATFKAIDAGANDQMLFLESPLVDSNGNPVCGGVPLFTVGNLGLKDVGANYRFRVKARPMGWFGDENNPSDRFDMSFSFNTK